ncbi:MAG: NADH-quinone oxidoreductase subunit NuoK [Leptonema sp. (in: Bacteria)]|nr:NADH-quinone oxidoreductase subunit NuoK [Leptonema sp. (in: bacteria)]
MTAIDPSHYIILSTIVFGLGVVGVITRKNIFIVLMSVELMLNAANLAFVTYSRNFTDMTGQLFVLFVIAIAAAEVSVGLAIIIALYRMKENIDLDIFNRLKG